MTDEKDIHATDLRMENVHFISEDQTVVDATADAAAAKLVLDALTSLNTALQAASRIGLSVEIDYATHQTFGHRYPRRHYYAAIERRLPIQT